MPIGPFGEVIGTTGTLDALTEGVQNYKTKVIAPRNPKLIKGKVPELKLKPSQYMFQMSMSTEQKLANMHTINVPRKTELLDMSEISHQKASNINIDEPMFQPFPSEIFFQNFQPFETYEVPFQLRNNDKVPRLVKVTQENSPYFNIVSPSNVGHKVGPGLPTIFKIQFTPEENKDYYHELLCITEREKFVVPVRAIGARAIVDFPDDVVFPTGPVKNPTTKTLLVRNIGNRDAKFSLSTEKPFSVGCTNYTLEQNASTQIHIEFQPMEVGDHQRELVVHYDTGEKVFVSLYGAATNANVRLDKNSIRIENTYISMANQRMVIVNNRSNVIAHFRWTEFATQMEEDQQKDHYMTSLNLEEITEKDKFMEECIADPALRDKMSILNRTFQNKKRMIAKDRMVFLDEAIKIEPLEGDIWPNSSAEITVIFKPEQAHTYTCTAFCDVTGRESRLPLRIRGDGIGPKVQFAHDIVDIGNIFVNSTHVYEVVLANKGDIDAIFSLVPPQTVFGPCFHFNPSEGIVMPDGHQAIEVTFNSAIIGDFKEEFQFQIDGSPSKLKITFTGSVIGPTFHFDVPKLVYNQVSFGFVNTLETNLYNTSLIPMTFTLRVPGDGSGENISKMSHYDSTIIDSPVTVPPKEFEIIPYSGVLDPKSSTPVKVAFCSNTVRKYDLSLVVDVAGVGPEVLSLPISASCVVPSITVLTPVLDYGRCFINHPYEHHVRMRNDTDLPTKYELVSQLDTQDAPILYSCPQPKGILEKHSVTEVPLIITPQRLEETEITSHFVIFGNPRMPLPVHLTCIGEGPVIHVVPNELDWGQIPVLTDVLKTIRLSNESLIPARFTTQLLRPNTVWSVDPPCGEVAPEDQLELTITAHLDDCVKFQDRIQINVENTSSRTVFVTAHGSGTTIVIDPPMSPVLNLGPHFSRDPCQRLFTMTNKGRRHQSVVWTTEGFHTQKRPSKTSTTQRKSSNPQSSMQELTRPVFGLTPHRMDLNPGKSLNVILEGYVDTPQVVNERLLCHAITGRAGGKELIMKVNINCQFIAPLLEFSTRTMSFSIDKKPHDELTVQSKELEVTNVSSLPLTIVLNIDYPFDASFTPDNLAKELCLGVGESKVVQVTFDPAYRPDAHSRIIDTKLTISYREHPHMDVVTLRGEVHFPNIEFEKSSVDFGCILNDTEVTRYINITNCSPMDVKYHWSFLIDDDAVTVFQKPELPGHLHHLVTDEMMDNAALAADVEETIQADLDAEVALPPGWSPSSIHKKKIVHLATENGDDDDEEEKKDQEKAVDESEDEEGHRVEEYKEEKADDKVESVDTGTETGKLEVHPMSGVSVSGAGSTVGTPEAMDDDEDNQEKSGGVDLTSPIEELELPTTVSRAAHIPSPDMNPVLAALLQKDTERLPLGVEEIFDILPLYGELKPGDTEQVTLTFYGHSNISSKVKAICKVEGGPSYEFYLKGQASFVDYKFDTLEIDCEKIMYDQVDEREITLFNTGQVGFAFTAFGMDPGMSSHPKPGVPVLIPHTGFIEASCQTTLTIRFLPGVPDVFRKTFSIQVAHFEPDIVTVNGEGVFPRISLDLPRLVTEEYDDLLKSARENVALKSKTSSEEILLVHTNGGQASPTKDGDAAAAIETPTNQDPSDLDVQMEAERVVVSEFAKEMHALMDEVDILSLVPDTAGISPYPTVSSDLRKQKMKQGKLRAQLPEYVLNFGHVILGTVRTHIVRATNTGWFPSSFSVERGYLNKQGFNIELNRIKQLPGAPDHQTVDFIVSFDPRGANLGLGLIETKVPINIYNGPQVCICMKANVTMPDMSISTDVLEFEEVKCGECKVITIQLHNHMEVRCEWTATAVPPKDKRTQAEKHIPMHLRRKGKSQKLKPKTFETMPSYGFLLPGQRHNIQIKFMPAEERFYEQLVNFRLGQSSHRITLLCRGQGLEPHIDFERNLIEFGPVLPHSVGDEQEVVVRNNCSFPIEIYNLEFDKSYLEEEKILRLMKGYDEYNTIPLPPRQTLEKLPHELLEYYEEHMKKLEEEERARKEAEEAAYAAHMEELAKQESEEKEGEEHKTDAVMESLSKGEVTVALTVAPPSISEDIQSRHDMSVTESRQTKEPEKKESEHDESQVKEEDKPIQDEANALDVGELEEISPVSAAIARHLGIDLSPEGRAARNRCGIGIIVHGAPISGKTTTAVMLAKHYEVALVTVDSIVQEAIASGSTPAGLRAREMCMEAAYRRADEFRIYDGEDGEKKGATAGLSVEALTAHTQGSGGAGSGVAAHSVAHSTQMSNRKTSSMFEGKAIKPDKHHAGNVGGKAGTQISGEGGSQVPSSPLPLNGPIAQRLSISGSIGGEYGLLSTVLQQELLVDILADRLMLNDCHRGVVFDGLDTLFSQNNFTTLHAILRALNNRKFIYFVTLKLDYSRMKEEQKQAEEEKERLAQVKEEEEKQRLEDMSEDEYDALTEEEKARVDKRRLASKKERLRKEMQERQERERLEKEAQEAEQRRLEEEKQSKKKRRQQDGKEKESGKKEKEPKKIADSKSQDRVAQLKSQDGPKRSHGADGGEHTIGKIGSGTDRPDSGLTNRAESAVADDGKKKKEKSGKDGRRPISNDTQPGKKEGDCGQDDLIKDLSRSEAEMLLLQRFRTFEYTFKDICDLLDQWERAVGVIRPPTPVDGADNVLDDTTHAHPPSGKKGKKDKHDKSKDKDKEKDKDADKKGEKQAIEKSGKDVYLDGQTLPEDGDASTETPQALTQEEKKQRHLEEGIGVPHVIVDCHEAVMRPPVAELLETDKLPSLEDVLDGLGLGENGPPVPPPATFGIVPYPVERNAPPGADGGHYVFIASTFDDPNIGLEEKPVEEEPEEEKVPTPTKDDTPTKGRGKGKDKDKDQDKKGRKTSARGQRERGGIGRRVSSVIPSPPPGAQTPISEADGSTGEMSQDARLPKLMVFRWVIPANGETLLRLRFVSEELGQFDQTLNFEIVGTRRRYQLYCRGTCAFPTISREPRIVFPHRKKNKRGDEIVHRKYLLTTEIFEFGPLLVGKSRDKYKERRYPENNETLTIQNTSPLEADVTFCFLEDSKGETFLLDPPSMLLKSGESQDLNIWAYPKMPGTYEDALVCCIKENPEPVIFKIICFGVRPELELDRKSLHFEKVLIHRKDTKTLFLRNTTLLPVQWRLSGLENLGDDFSMSQESGVIEAKSEFQLHSYFRALKPMSTSKKAVRLEVSDIDNIMGLVQTENIMIYAEAYDVALDMSFPKGADGGIDFDILRVTEEQKQICSLKNKGKYDISYSFTFEMTEQCGVDILKMFSVLPQRGTLSAIDRPAQVQVIFRSSKEVIIKDQPILRCRVIEPNIGDEGEIIASIPIKLSVKSVYSKYNIVPVNDINFGPMLVNSKKVRTFIIENKGERFEFKYTIAKLVKEASRIDDKKSRLAKPDKFGKSRDGSSSGRSGPGRPKRAESVKQDVGGGGAGPSGGGGGLGGANQARLVLGPFTVSPAFGFILPGGQQVITVECIAETPEKFEETLAIDITGRDPNDRPQGIPYKLLCDACVPSINTREISAIFEEHRICKNLSLWLNMHKLEQGGVYGEDENRFVFSNVLVGTRAKARFKISNDNKVPCDVVFSIRPLFGASTSTTKQLQQGSRHADIFEVEPQREQIAAHSYIYAVVSFTPPSLQYYSAVFEAVVENLTGGLHKTVNLIYEVSGEGNLPRVTIISPSVRNKKGQPLLLYKKNLVGRTEVLPLKLTNEGTLASKVDIDLADPDEVFSMRPSGTTKAVMTAMPEDGPDAIKRPHTASVVIGVGETATFDVFYKPVAAQRSQGHLRLSIIDNQYEDSVIQLVAEGYIDDITLDNIHSVFVPQPVLEDADGNNADDDVEAAKSNHIQFGDCYISDPKVLTFAMTNHSKSDVMRFQWPAHDQMKFSPMTGHLHPGRSKDITVTFKASEPIVLTEVEVACRVVKIIFTKASNEGSDWDDRLRVVRWVDVNRPATGTSGSNADGTPKDPSPPVRPSKRKVVEMEHEPRFTEVAESARNVDLLVSANADYCKPKVKVSNIHFKDTLMMQTRSYEFQLVNKGTVSMDFNWHLVSDGTMVPSPKEPRSVTFATGESTLAEEEEEDERPATALPLVVRSEHIRLSSPPPSSVISDVAYLPFTIEPETGMILPGKKQNIKVKFNPLDVNEFECQLSCSIPNVDPERLEPTISIKACSLMPYCHFDLENSDYIRSARRNPELPGPNGAPAGTTLDPSTKVIEFSSIGVGLRTQRIFDIMNPTHYDYSFHWVNEDHLQPKNIHNFRCLTPDGIVIKSGKQAKIIFEFLSTNLDLMESFWRFKIPQHNISLPFLLVGHTTDPQVAFDRSHLNFGSLLIGHPATKVIQMTNMESMAFSFSFVEGSCHASSHGTMLKVTPMEGVILPKSSLEISIVLVPSSDKEVNFNLVCHVKKKMEKLMLNVKAEGYSMDCLVLCEDSKGKSVELSSNGCNEINFGQVDMNEAAIRNINIVNSGKFNFDFTWVFQMKGDTENTSLVNYKDSMVSVQPMTGNVPHGNKQMCQLEFCTPRQISITNCRMQLKISNGPTYKIKVAGSGTAPGLHFSFLTHNFGPSFIYHAGLPHKTKKLYIINRDKKDISIDCIYPPTQHLYHNFKAQVITPGETVIVNFEFYPRAAIRYTELVEFEVNGRSKNAIEFSGLGTEMKVEAVDANHKVIKFGTLQVGQTVRRSVPIINRSPAQITFHVAIMPTNPRIYKQNAIKVAPSQEVTLAPNGGTMTVDVTFSPKSRISHFTEEVILECSGLPQPLFIVQGACHGMEIFLDTNSMPFGAVVQYSSYTRKLLMYNNGDIGAKFRWNQQKFAPDFSIVPSEGYISPAMQVSFDVTFHPNALSNDIRYDRLKCAIEGTKQALNLTLTGMCVAVPPVKEVLHFATAVRQKDTRNLMVPNRTNMHWNIRPIIEGEHWKGPEWLNVEPQTTKPYEITYQPLVMTTSGNDGKHVGTVFFPLPDGTGLLYNMSGTADPPKPNSRITRDVPCKTTYTEVLSVLNWLKHPQRFRVRIEWMRPEKPDPGTIIDGLDYIDVGGNGKRDYRLSFYANKESQPQIKVLFMNETTGEFQFYEIQFRAGRPGVLATFDLTTPVRQTLPYTIKLDNSLNYPITFSASCNSPDVMMPSQLAIPAQSEGIFNLEYLPLKVGEAQCRLEFTCNDLGLYMYDLNMKATAAGPERAVYFRTTLGSNQIHQARFINYAKQKTDYTCKVDNADFHVDKTVAAAPGSSSGIEIAVDVTYEPSQIGESRSTLVLSSPIGGDYTVPLFGTCSPAKPQGPFIVKAGSTTSISFRNVFQHTTTFTFQVDNPLFHVMKPGESIRSHKDHRIIVGFDGCEGAAKAAVMGKLVVSCARSAGGSSNAQWIYYLKGVTL